MRRGTSLAIFLCLALAIGEGHGGRSCFADTAFREVPPDSVMSQVAPDSTISPARPDTIWSRPTADSVLAGGGYGDSASVQFGEMWPGLSAQLPPGLEAERATYKSLWELLSTIPNLRWTGSGALGGVEAISLRGRAMRRASVIADGGPSGPDMNMATPSLVDSVSLLSGISMLEEVLTDGADAVEVFTGTRAGESQEGFLSVSRGDFLSRYNTFSFSRRSRSYWFGLRLAGASFGGAASYSSYTRDGGAFGGEYRLGSGLTLGVQGWKFRSKLIRYTADKTKTKVNSLMLSAANKVEGEITWQARTYFLGNDFSYSENGPDVEDELATIGTAIDFWPGGTGGRHRLSLGLRRETLERTIGPFVVPEELDIDGPPDEGGGSSVDASVVYSLGLWKGDESQARGVVRMDRKELFGWEPSWAAWATRYLGSLGQVEIQGGRSAYMPGFSEIYAPRDETARPTWYMASNIQPEAEWNVSASWKLATGAWTMSAGGFGAIRDHVLAPSTEWLGLNREPLPAVTSPLEDLGDGSATGFWGSVDWELDSWFKVGGWYSALRTRAGGDRLPFEPSHKAGLWIWGERKYFGDDMRVGLLLRGLFHSTQATNQDTELPSYGLGEAMGYVTVSDVVFFYQLKNLETRPRPSMILDVTAGEYLLQPGPEVRFGLVWYLPG